MGPQDSPSRQHSVIPEDLYTESAPSPFLFADEDVAEPRKVRSAAAVPQYERIGALEIVSVSPGQEEATQFADEGSFEDVNRPFDLAADPPRAYTPRFHRSGAVDRVRETIAAVGRILAAIEVTPIGIVVFLLLCGGVVVGRLRAPNGDAGSPIARHGDVHLAAPDRTQLLGTSGSPVATRQGPAGHRLSESSKAQGRKSPERSATIGPPVLKPEPRSEVPRTVRASAAVSAADLPETPGVSALPALIAGQPAIVPSAPPPQPVPDRTVLNPSGATHPPDASVAVRAALSRYADAYGDLDAAAVSAVWPSVDRAALTRAFDALDAQQVTFDRCDIQVDGATGRATCVGTAMWLPKVGGKGREQNRTWKFVLKNAAGTWQIVTADAR